MEIWLHFLLFAIPGFLIYYGLYYLTPKLVKKGVPLIFAFWSCLWIPVIALLPLAISLADVIDGMELSRSAVVERFHLHPLRGSDWLWVGGAVIATILLDQLLEPIGKYFARKKAFAPPPYLPAPFNPLHKFTFPPHDFFGVKLAGNWKLLLLFIPLHLVAMFSEEMMWRGFLLPLQVAIFGDLAWVLNGLLWAWIVHACLKWHFVGMLPSMLIAPFIAQLTGSTLASFFVHAIPNSLLWIILLLGIIQKKDNQMNTPIS
ncbi:CPBP family intramembrane metalloprotease [Anaerobacillus alkaliphilus]|uniref:CPBP family intramembrane metalloprotease n=1 Tax=Anaerobacillus alkaliphilus TaxID=1548597 RepID=A0A4Q0VZC1_9BACI|nr:CPBP family glutamic-type intramembrane protease [Anaerobacillus alkaliphilus]RXJ04388.1 CPBP family intramembrane metalloprotease [Anaerobacillus alkaliphilus]